MSREQAYALDLCYKCGLKSHIAKYCEEWHQQQQQQQKASANTVAEVTQRMEQLHTQSGAQTFTPVPQVKDYHASAEWVDQQITELAANSVQGN